MSFKIKINKNIGTEPPFINAKYLAWYHVGSHNVAIYIVVNMP